MSEPTQAAMRAANDVIFEGEEYDWKKTPPTNRDLAQIIDRETGLPELIAALNACFGVIEALPDPDKYEVDAMERVKAALKIAREGRS